MKEFINNTKTYNASDLFNLKDNSLTKNIKLENDNIIVINEEDEAIYVSTSLNIDTFMELVLSFNFKSSKNTNVSFMVSIGNEKNMSDFFIMGEFFEGYYQSVKNEENDFGSVLTDILIIKNENNSFFKLKFIVNRNSDNFKLNNISITKKKDTSFVFDEALLIEKIIDVPKINQRSVPKIGNSICSPTSLTMVLNYYGNNLNNSLVAKDVFDYGSKIYGNWTFNASYSYNYGLYSRVEYISDFKDIINYIKQDIPVIMSISVATIKDPNYEINYPYGHLVVLTGFKKENNVWYAAVNDPATFKDEEVLKFYKLDAFLSAFKNYTYIIKKNNF